MRKDVTDDIKVVEEILSRADVITLALVDAEGPYSVPVNFACEGGVVYFHSAKKGRKAAALHHGGKVAFSASVDHVIKKAEEACKWGYKFRSVLGSGTPRLIVGKQAEIDALNTLMRKYAGGDSFPYDERVLEVTDVWAIDIDRATARLKQS